MTYQTAPERWAGWHRPPGGRWVRLAEGEDYGECWSLLLARMPKVGGESIVLIEGRHPGETSVRRTR